MTSIFKPRLATVSTLLAAMIPAAVLSNACILRVEGDDGDDDSTTTGTNTSTTTGSGTSSTSSTSGTGTGSDTDSTATTSSDTTSTATTTTSDTSGVDLGACDRNLVPTTTITENSIESDTTWSGVVAVTTNVDVNGAVLTIAPGTTVLVDPDVSIEVGWNGSTSAIFANGTAAAPIHFCGKSFAGTNVQWNGLEFGQNVTSNSVLAYTTVEDAGTADVPALKLRTGLKLDNVSVSGADGVGVEAVDFGAGSQNLSVSDSAGYPVRLVGEKALTNLPLGGTYVDNAMNMVEIDFSSIESATLVHNPGIPYAQTTNVDVLDDLTIEAGVEYLFGADATLEIGWNGTKPNFAVNGTTAQPVVFGGTTAMPGWWGGIEIVAGTLTSSKLANVTVRDGGANDNFPLDVQAAVALENVSVTGNLRGLSVGKNGLASTSTNLSSTANGGPALTTVAEALASIPSDGSFVGNDAGFDIIAVEGGDWQSTAVVPKQSVPYRIESNITAYDNAKVTIEAGAHFVMRPDTHIEFGWNGSSVEVQVLGSADEMVVFEGEVATAGSWEGLIVGSSALSTSKFDYVEIAHGGGDGSLLELNRAVPVTNSTFRTSSDFAIKRKTDDATDYITGNTFTDIADDKRVGDL
jgi:hypothetical protein